jgi:hypothetical protein
MTRETNLLRLNSSHRILCRSGVVRFIELGCNSFTPGPSFAQRSFHRSHVGDPTQMDIFYLQNTIETTRSYIRKNRSQAVGFMKGYIEGIAYFKKSQRESRDIRSKGSRIAA